VPIIKADAIGMQGVSYTATTIYLTPTTLSAITFNFLLSLSGGLITGYVVSKGGAFWTYSCGLAGIITASAGNDLYHPLQAMLIGMFGAAAAYKLHYFVERRFKIDDAVGAVAVHGYCGAIGVVVAGFMLWGHPAMPFADSTVNPFGQIVGAVIMFGVLGFLPAYVLAAVLKAAGLLRIPYKIELVGLDVTEYEGRYLDDAEVRAAELKDAQARGVLRPPAPAE
jgi:ammonia channel protein AmtB